MPSELQKEATAFNYCVFRMRGSCADLGALQKTEEYIDPETYEMLVKKLLFCQEGIVHVRQCLQEIQQSRILAREHHGRRRK